MAKKGKKVDTNLDITTKGNKVIITIDLDQEVGESKSGKSMLIATAGAGIMIDDMKLNLNLYKSL
jgi:hypothetical protein